MPATFGLASSNRRLTPETLRAAIAELREAVRLDTEFVAGWAEMAQVQMDAFRQGGLMVGDADRARASLERALALAPDLPDVRAASARYHLRVTGDFPAALRDYRWRSALRRPRGPARRHRGDGAEPLAGSRRGPGERPGWTPARRTPRLARR